MNTESEFRAFDDSISHLWRGSELVVAIEKRWLDKADRNAFYQWKIDKMRLRRSRQAIPPEKILPMLLETNFNDASEREELERAVNSGVEQVYLPLGVDSNGQIYRILRGTNALITYSTKSFSRPLFPSYILGVNTNPVAPASENKEDSKENAKSNESDESEASGFVFFQLGMVESFTGTDIAEGQSHL
ncbi:hypothetical protein G7Y89_g13359 [Cudoniella acicularis]|uniref:Uncharacterized protein n=1 Tax=Cudoniella acicularis TaxID=354080 RepID=A0A8H4VYS7_9HELO|nr:hypothetical protein G7Y89_g13359 [Cudoniella acicularis]